MANRRDYNVTLLGEVYNTNPFGGSSTISGRTSKTATRVATDYNRRKPPSQWFGGKKWLPPTSYSMTETLDVRPTGAVRSLGLYGYTTNSGILANTTHPGFAAPAWNKCGVSTTFPSGLANRALMQARLKVKELGSSVNFAQAFAEVGQTARFVANNLDRMAGIIALYQKEYRRRLRRYANRRDIDSVLLRESLDAWLELQYALKPLMGDIHGSVTSLDESSPFDNSIVTVKASSKSKIDETVPINVSSSDDWTSHFTCRVKCEHGSFVRIDLVPDSAWLIKASAMGFTNPAALGWELTRLSFVVDWAYPLGDYFSQFDALLGYQVKGFSQSNLTKINSTVTGDGYTKQNGYPTIQEWTGRYNYVNLGRTGGTTVPFAELPSFKNPLSASHVISALALLRQAVVD